MSLQRLRRSQPPSANKMLSESPTVTGNWRIEEAAYPCVGASFDRAGMLAQWYNLRLDTRETRILVDSACERTRLMPATVTSESESLIIYSASSLLFTVYYLPTIPS